jgi:hypothetical protein
MWQLLQISDSLDREFLSALSTQVRALGWIPQMTALDLIPNKEREEILSDPYGQVRHFPLQRGYSRWPFSVLANIAVRQTARLKRAVLDPAHSPLICTTPYWAPVAEKWPGPVVYYLTDLMAAYEGVSRNRVRSFDARMCQAATLVCPNSARIADYLEEEAVCPPGKIEVLPNATRASNVLPQSPQQPFPLPHDLDGLKRPVAGVIGNLASNMDWVFLEQTIERTPGFSWALVGPAKMAISEPEQREARERLMAAAGGRIRFTGGKKYGELSAYARCFDVAVLPYLLREPTFSGSSTRFYEHLAACRPMIATCGFEELLRKTPLLRLVSGSEEAVSALMELRTRGFNDGLLDFRWRTSRLETWEARAARMIQALRDRGEKAWSNAWDGAA